jgi:hypothetical protein
MRLRVAHHAAFHPSCAALVGRVSTEIGQRERRLTFDSAVVESDGPGCKAGLLEWMPRPSGEAPGFGIELLQALDCIDKLLFGSPRELAGLVKTAVGRPSHVHPVIQFDSRAKLVK